MTADENMDEATLRLREAIEKAVAERLAEEDARTDAAFDKAMNDVGLPFDADAKAALSRAFRAARQRLRDGVA
jgi:hypothetical protein